MEILRATVEDLSEIQRLNIALLTFENTVERNIWDPAWTHSIEGETFFRSRLMDRNYTYCYIAKVEAVAIGYVLGFVEVHKWRTKKMVGFIRHLVVDEKFRDQGVGTELMNRLLSDFKLRGLQVFRVEALVHNLKAMEFYKNFGFKEKTTFMEIENL